MAGVKVSMTILEKRVKIDIEADNVEESLKKSRNDAAIS